MPRFTVLETSALFSNRVKYDYLFELEMWLKGLERFFQIDCLPLSAFERSHASLRNYVEEVAAARSGVAHMGLIATQLMGEGQEDLASFLLYLDTQVQRAGARKRGDGTTELARVDTPVLVRELRAQTELRSAVTTVALTPETTETIDSATEASKIDD